MITKVQNKLPNIRVTDDERSELISCPLTTVRQPAFDIGKTAAQKLIDTIDNSDEPIETIVLKNEIIIRQLCGCPSG